MSERERALEHLARADRALRASVPAPLSLAPDRSEATSLVALGAALLDEAPPPGHAAAFARGLDEILRSQIDAFPNNLFWDFDRLAFELAEQPDPSAIERFAARIVSLNALFGARSAIRFRYVHDFVFGFDWARWVQRDAPVRAKHGPFSVVFFDYLERRGGELLDLIEQDDAKYRRLPPDQTRNPFTFSREPEHELSLHRALAAQGVIPVPAWRAAGGGEWNRPFSELRRRIAEQLGLAIS